MLRFYRQYHVKLQIAGIKRTAVRLKDYATVRDQNYGVFYTSMIYQKHGPMILHHIPASNTDTHKK